MDDLMKRLARAASDEFGTPAESRELARDALAKIKWLDAAVATMEQDNTQDSEELARLHALVTCEPSFSSLHNHTACVAEEMERLRAENRAMKNSAESLATRVMNLVAAFERVCEERDTLRGELTLSAREAERLRLIAAQHSGLVEERDHYRERARTLGMRFDWAQHVAATAMREGVAACESLRDAACLADDMRELAERQRDHAMDRLRFANDLSAMNQQKVARWCDMTCDAEERLDAARAEVARLRAVVDAVRFERNVRAEWLKSMPTCERVPVELVVAEDATGAALDALAGGLP